MNEKTTTEKVNRDNIETSPIHRRKHKNMDRSNTTENNSWLVSLLCAWFKASNKNKRRVEDKYESILYLQPREDSKDDTPLERKPDFNKALSSGMGKSSNDELAITERR